MSASRLLAPSMVGIRRGLARASNDFMFEPGLVYLQTGSLGPTPRPVMDFTVAKWRELELDPVYYGYGPQEQATPRRVRRWRCRWRPDRTAGPLAAHALR